MALFVSLNYTNGVIKNLPETLDAQLRTKLQNLLTYEEGIYNAMIYPYSNGKIEAKIPISRH